MSFLHPPLNAAFNRAGPSARLVGAWALLVLFACSKGGGRESDSARPRAPGDESREIAVAVDRSVSGLTRTEWKSSSVPGGGTALVSAFRDPQALRLIRERVDRPGLGGMANRYYFANGHLRYYESEGEVSSADSTGKTPVKRRQHVVLAYDFRGTMVEGSRQLDNESAPTDSSIVKGAMERALQLLREEAKAPPPSAKDKKS